MTNNKEVHLAALSDVELEREVNAILAKIRRDEKRNAIIRGAIIFAGLIASFALGTAFASAL